MTSADDIHVYLTVTPDMPYPRYAAACLYSLARSNPGVRVHLNELDWEPYPEGVVPLGFPNHPDYPGWCIILDADSWVWGDLRQVLPPAGYDLSLRLAKVNTIGAFSMVWWAAICKHFRLPIVPIYANGLIACGFEDAGILKDELHMWMRKIRAAGLPDPLHLKHRPEWWMIDQFALAFLIAERSWRVRELGPDTYSWNYMKRERGGVVRHVGKHDAMGERLWPQFRIAKPREEIESE